MSPVTTLIRCARDSRGVVFEPLDAGELAAQRNVHVVITEPGQVRGNHFHKVAAEVCAVVGPALVRVQEGDELSDFVVAAGEIRRFSIPPGVAHAIRNEGSQACVLVSFTTQPHDPQHPDTYRRVLLEPTSA